VVNQGFENGSLFTEVNTDGSTTPWQLTGYSDISGSPSGLVTKSGYTTQPDTAQYNDPNPYFFLINGNHTAILLNDHFDSNNNSLLGYYSRTVTVPTAGTYNLAFDFAYAGTSPDGYDQFSVSLAGKSYSIVDGLNVGYNVGWL